MRIIKVSNCKECPYRGYEALQHYPSKERKIFDFCSRSVRTLEKVDEIPEWCLLEKA